MKNFLTVDSLELSFNDKLVLNALNLKVKEGDVVAITGSSGSGKTSLLRAICGLEQCLCGEITLNNKILLNNEINIPTNQRNVGLVLQEKVLFPHLTAIKNIEFGISDMKNKNETCHEIMKKLKILHLTNKYPHELSGGESQRVALARTIVTKPKLLMLDEPFTGLDEELKLKIYPEIKSILRERNTTCLMVSHDLNEVTALADKCFKLESGKLIEI